MREALTPDASAFTSSAALARQVGVHRDQVRLWRLNDNAPEGLGLSVWRNWFLDTGRHRYAESIPAILTAGAGTPAAADDDQASPPAEAGDVPEEDEGRWKARTARARALLAERELAESEGALVRRDLFTAALRRLGAGVLEMLLQSKAWDALAPELDGLTPPQRRAIHAAYERWMMDLRGRLALLPASVGADVLPRHEAIR